MMLSVVPIQCLAVEASDNNNQLEGNKNGIPISTKEELNNIRYDLSSDYYLCNDIIFDDSDFSEGGAFYNNGEGWIPIGAGYLPLKVTNKDEFDQYKSQYGTLYYKNSSFSYCSAYEYDDFYSTYYYKETFTGNFDGNGYSIKNLHITTNNRKYSGLFGIAKGEICDLGIVDCNIDITNTHDRIEFGAIVAYGQDIHGCYATGKINITTAKNKGNGYIGGITGYSVNISECANYANINVSGDAYVGGIVGLSCADSKSYIENCYNAGDIKSRSWIGDDWSGGIVGNWQRGIVKNCYNVGKSCFAITSRIYGDTDKLRNLYYLSSECEYPFSDYNTALHKYAKTYDEMILNDTYQGYDFDNIWTYGDSTYPYPILARLGEIDVVVNDKNPCAKGHNFSAWEFVDNATHKRICKNNPNHVELVQHNYSNEWTIDKKATCTENGSKSHHCMNCSAKKDITTIPKEHSYSNKWTTDKKATCTKAGSKSHHCTKCSAKKDVTTIKATGHSTKNYTTKATLSSNGKVQAKCTKCNKITKTTTIYRPTKFILSTTKYTYNGKVKTPSLTVKAANGKTISSSNYTVTKSSGRKNVGKYTYKIVFKGNYSGTKSVSFVINPKSTSVSKLKATSKGFKATWKKQSTQTSGYQIQYSTSSKFKNPKTVTVSNNKSTSKSIKKLKSKKKYYVRVRTYRKVSGTKYYSSWSSSKRVTTKR